jgi:hypothetical protein
MFEYRKTPAPSYPSLCFRTVSGKYLKMAAGWKEISPGYYERPLDELELGHDKISRVGSDIGRGNFTISTATKVENIITDFIPAVRQAWKTLGYDEPAVASFDDREMGSRSYTVATQDELEIWLEESFRVFQEDITLEELFLTLPVVKRPALYVLSRRQKILFRCSHVTNR